jgi:hypothetical protein
MRKLLCVIISFFIFSFENFAQTQSGTFNPIADNTIFQENAAVSNGTGGQIFVGRTAGTSGTLSRRSFIKFNLSSIPLNATITNVTLKVTCSQVPSAAVDNIIGLQKCISSWGEGTSNGGGQGAPATTGDVTWTCRFSSGGSTCSSTWINAGGDFSPTISSSVLIRGLGDYIFPNTIDLIADVQSWVNNAAGNFGWVLKGNEAIQRNAKSFLSRESFPEATVLSVSYTVSSCSAGNTWTGTIDNKWETPGNWSCGSVPIATTNVIINNGTIIVNSNAQCKSLTVNPAAVVTVNQGFNLTVHQ